MIGQISGARRRSERTLPRRPELAVKGPGWPSGGSGHSCQSGWSGTVAPESWGRGPCPISRAPGATADLAGCIGQWTLQGPALHGKPLPLGA